MKKPFRIGTAPPGVLKCPEYWVSLSPSARSLAMHGGHSALIRAGGRSRGNPRVRWGAGMVTSCCSWKHLALHPSSLMPAWPSGPPGVVVQNSAWGHPAGNAHMQKGRGAARLPADFGAARCLVRGPAAGWHATFCSARETGAVCFCGL